MVRDTALLLLRVVVGLIFVGHGWQKLFIAGIVKTTGQFSAWSIPQPQFSAWLVPLTELIGGGLLIIGFLSTFLAGILAILVALAAYFVHFDRGLYFTEGGLEFPLLMFVALLVIMVFGAGRASVDGVLTRG